MDYGITRRVLGCKEFIAISKIEFENAIGARDSFFNVLGIEEKFDLLAENYAEFEGDLAHLSMRQMLFHDIDWSSMRSDIGTINRRLANLMSACRLYVDHVKHDISSIYGKTSPIYKQLSEALSHEYDSRVGYCVLEALRNHIQHCGLPLYQLDYPSSRTFPGNTNRHRKYMCTPSISIERLKEKGALKYTLLQRLKSDIDLFDMRPLVRDHMSGLGNVHKQLREWLADDIKRWESILIEIRDRFRAIYGDRHPGLAVVERDHRNCTSRYAEIFDDFFEEYARLLRKNRYPEHYATQFVSTEAATAD